MDNLGDLFGGLGDALGEIFGSDGAAEGAMGLGRDSLARRPRSRRNPTAVVYERYLCGGPRKLNVNDR